MATVPNGDQAQVAVRCVAAGPARIVERRARPPKLAEVAGVRRVAVADLTPGRHTTASALAGRRLLYAGATNGPTP
jgi:hypothetical protein